VRGVGREAVVEGCDAGEGRGWVGENGLDGGFSAGGGLEGIAPGAAVDVAGGIVSMVGIRMELEERTLSIGTFRGQIGREIVGAIYPASARDSLSRCTEQQGCVWGRWGLTCFTRKLGCKECCLFGGVQTRSAAAAGTIQGYKAPFNTTTRSNRTR
jgi:hypothetical protein